MQFKARALTVDGASKKSMGTSAGTERNSFLPLLLMLFIAWTALFLLARGVSAQDKAHGTLDLRDWDDSVIVPLAGPWQVVRGKLVRPADFYAAYRDDVTIFPDRWHDADENRFNVDWPAGFGAASYRMKLLLPVDGIQYALKLQTPYSSYELWVNGNKVAASGTPTEAPAGFQAFYLERIIPLPRQSEVELTLLVSNFEHFAGGVLRPPLFAGREQLEQDARAYDLSYLFVLGALCALLVFQFAYFSRSFSSNPEWSHFWYCILLVVLIVRLATLTTMPFKLFPAFPHFSTKTLEYLTLFSSTAVYVTFLASMFPKEFPRLVRRLIYFLSVPFVISVLAFPVSFFTQLQDAFILFALATLLYSQGAILVAWRRKRDGAGAILLFTALFLFTAVNDSLLYLHSVNVRPSSFPDLMPFGFLFLSIGYAIALSAQSRAVFDHAQQLAGDLSQLNKTLDERVITRTKEADAAKQLAEKSAAEKANFISAASHDLRQPVHALNLFNQTFQHRVADDQLLSALAAKQQNLIGSLSEMLEIMLEASRLEANTLTAAMTEVRLTPFFETIKNTLQLTAAEHDVSLKIVASSLSVYADPKHLKRVVVNLLMNAIKASPGGRVLLGARPYGDNIRLDIWDNGMGIEEKDQRLVFDRYVQLSQKKSSGPAGLGLGLSIVADLCKLMKMPVELWSEPGKGTRFQITAQRFKGALEVPSVGQVNRLQATTKRLLLLVVDDDQKSLEAMVELFRQWGHSARGVSSYEAALATLEDLGMPDMLITDYRLSAETTGLDLYASMSALYPGLKALVVTGATAPEDLKALAASGLPVLHKPLDAAKMRQYLDQQHTAR
jgi:signal transduction histidine kinase/CheY-like chemotaxis protein